MTTHILIVDDDPLRAKMLTFLLVDAGYAASTLADPRAADCGSGGTAVDLALVDATAPPRTASRSAPGSSGGTGRRRSS
jgi:DNA-binding response OmpR family regulator